MKQYKIKINKNDVKEMDLSSISHYEIGDGADFYMARLQPSLNCYSIFPNLTWQR